MTACKFIIFLLMFVPSSVAASDIIDLGTVGTTYAIAEPDALKEIQIKAAEHDGPIVDPDQAKAAIRNYKPATVALPHAKADRTFYTQITHVLDFDITDAGGSIIYPAGYTYNPLQYIYNPQTYAFIDGTEIDQLSWFMSSDHNVNDTTLLITDGLYMDVMELTGRHVFYASPEIIAKFGVNATPSIVQQVGERLRIDEYNYN